MRKFIEKIILFSCIFLGTLFCFLLLSAQDDFRMPIAELTKSGDYVYEDFGAKEIIPFVERVQEYSDHSKLIIGDSVCHQIFDRFYEVNDEFCIAGSNQAISLSGQYILAKEFVKNHDNVTDIYLVLIMRSLATDYSLQLGYQYAVMPFVLTNTINDLDCETIQKMRKRYGALFCQKQVVDLMDRSPVCMKLYLNLLTKLEKWAPNESSEMISDVSWYYLKKLQELCNEEGVTLHLIPGPHADSEGNTKIEEELREMFGDIGGNMVLETYIEQVTYYPEELYKDGIHFDKKLVGDAFWASLAVKMIPGVKTE